MKWEIAAKLVGVASVEVSFISPLVGQFSKYSDILLIPRKTPTNWAKQLVVCDFSGDSGPLVFLALSITAFT